MAGKQYRPWNIDQQLMFPPSLRDWVPEDHLVFRILEAVSVLDVSGITRKIDASDPRGNQPFHPRMMLALLVYAYCCGIYSSRRIAQATYDIVPFRILTGDEHPHFTVINDFRARHREVFKDLFLQVLRLCGRAGLLDLEHIALDGTKVEANASKHKAMSYERMKRELERLEGEVGTILDRADQVDAEEDARYGEGRTAHELPEELKRSGERRRRLERAKQELEREAAETREKLLRRRAKVQWEKAETEADPVERKRQQSRAQKAQEEADRLAEQSGHKAGESTAEEPAASLPEHHVPTTPEGKPLPGAQRNFTDPDSRIMKRGGVFIQGFNCQCVIDGKHQIILAEAVTNQAPDQEHLPPMLEQVRKNLGRLPTRLTADAGYMSEDNVDFCEKLGVDAYLSVSRDKHRNQEECRCEGNPEKAAWATMRAKLRTPDGKTIYARRKTIVEPVFGQIKEARDFRRFSMRGLTKVRPEWTLICLCSNLLKLLRRTPAPSAGLAAEERTSLAPALA